MICLLQNRLSGPLLWEGKICVRFVSDRMPQQISINQLQSEHCFPMCAARTFFGKIDQNGLFFLLIDYLLSVAELKCTIMGHIISGSKPEKLLRCMPVTILMILVPT